MNIDRDQLFWLTLGMVLLWALLEFAYMRRQISALAQVAVQLDADLAQTRAILMKGETV